MDYKIITLPNPSSERELEARIVDAIPEGWDVVSLTADSSTATPRLILVLGGSGQSVGIANQEQSESNS